jgi:hypothetical protein
MDGNLKGFIKLREHGVDSKKPAERWREKQYKRSQLDDWVATGHNIGFATGTDDVVVLDIDNPQRVDELEIEPFHTYAVRTGGGGYHLYYRVARAKKVVLFDLEGIHLGELQCLGQYVVVPPSIHPSGNPYTVVDPDVPILEITQKELLSPFEGKIKVTKEIQVSRDLPVKIQTNDPLSRVSVVDVWDATVTESHGDQLFCVHPCHGSTTGHNLIIHPGKNVWQCRRCMSGGGVAMAIAVKYGVIRCDEARPGALRGEIFLEVLDVAKEHGFIRSTSLQKKLNSGGLKLE